MKILGIDSDYKVTEIVLADCPSYVSRYNMAMLSREDSPLIRIDSMVYYDEVNDLCEGDVVYIDGENVGIVYYSAGWKVLHKTTGESKDLGSFGHIKMNIEKSRNLTAFKEANTIEGRKPIRLVINTDEFSFDSLIVPTGDNIVIKGRRFAVPKDSIIVSTGLYDSNCKVIGFGAFFNGGSVIIDSNHDVAIKYYDGSIKKLNLEEETA